MKKIRFITTNKHKVEEMQAILQDFDIELIQKAMEYPEDKEADMESVAKKAAKDLADELNEPVIVEDTGIFFEACNNFPGAQPKFVVNGIGLEGILRLLKEEKRGAYFHSVIGYCEPGQEPVIFEGKLNGKITEEIINRNAGQMPYTKIFIPEGQAKTIVEMSLKEKNKISHRGKATRKLGEYLNKL
ncbi:RdgB/HAM1 family non-canonical purine NTP pyrophosphatase [Patescibacteria group bacterium]